MSITFTGSAFNSSNTSNYILTNNSNQYGTMALGVVPETCFLLRTMVNISSNNTTPPVFGLNWGDSNSKYYAKITPSNASLSFNSTPLATCNITPVFNSNVPLYVKQRLNQVKVYYNNAVLIDYFGSSNMFYNHGTFVYTGSNTASNQVSIQYPMFEPIMSFCNVAEFMSSVKVGGTLTANTITSTNFVNPTFTSLSNLAHQYQTALTSTTLTSSNLATSNLYFNSTEFPSVSSSSNSIVSTIGSNNSFQIKLNSGVNVMTVQNYMLSNTVDISNGVVVASNYIENGTPLVAKYAQSNTVTSVNANVTALSNFAYGLSNSMSNNFTVSNINSTSGGTIGNLVMSSLGLALGGYNLFSGQGGLANALKDVGTGGVNMNIDPNSGVVSALTGAFKYSTFQDGIRCGLTSLVLSNNQVSWQSNTTSNMYIGSNNLTVLNGTNFTFSNSVGSNWLFTSGMVGVGLTNPIYPMDVLGTLRASAVVAPSIQSTTGYLDIRSEYDVRYNADYDGNNLGAQHIFYSSSNEKMRITSAGNVGIGGTPSARLNVTDYDGTNDVTQYGIAQITQNSAGIVGRSNQSHIAFVRSGNTILGFGYAFGSNTFGLGQGTNSNNAFSPSLLSIQTTGNVGIGTLTPQSKLDVNGSINCSSNINASTMTTTSLTSASMSSTQFNCAFHSVPSYTTNASFWSEDVFSF